MGNKVLDSDNLSLYGSSGYNEYDLPVNSIVGIMPEQFYLLEVQIDGNSTQYLKFRYLPDDEE